MSVARTAKPNKSYAELVRQFPLRPIRSERELDRAMNVAGNLAIHKEGTLPTAEQDYLDTLTVLIEDYERHHDSDLPEATPLEMLKHLMEEHEMNISDLGRLIGSQSNASLVLSGKRAISKRVMQILSRHFKVDPGVFIEAPATKSTAAKSVGGGRMKVELNDRECYIAATALHVAASESEEDIEAEPSMENRLWRLDLVCACRNTMSRIDKEWRYRFYKVHGKKDSERIAGFEKGPGARRRISFDFDDRELEALTWALDIHNDGIGEVPAREVRALYKKLSGSNS